MEKAKGSICELSKVICQCRKSFGSASEMATHRKRCNLIIETEREITWYSCNFCKTNISSKLRSCILHANSNGEECKVCDKNLSYGHLRLCEANKKRR